jgi:hypothetical protein
MLAIAGGVSWLGYLVMVYGLSQLAGQNYSFLDLAIPGKFTLGTPAPDAPSAGGGGTDPNGGTTPCTAAQKAAGYTTDINGNCVPPANPAPGGAKGSAAGTNACFNNKTGKVIYVVGPCPNGYTAKQSGAGAS